MDTLRKRFRLKRRQDGPADTVVLHGTGRAVRAPSFSPFVLKLETFLRLAKIPYVLADDLTPSSKGKFPWISFNGEDVADSQLCIEYLNEKFKVDLNTSLTDKDKAIAHAFRIMLDEHHFWINAYYKFRDISDPNLLDDVPSWFIRRYIKRLSENNLQAQGLGRHSEQEVYAMLLQNLQVLEVFLGDKLFFMGDEPTEVDCSLFGLIGLLIFYPPTKLGHTLLKDKFPKLYQLCLRIKERAFPDWDECLQQPKQM